MSEGRQGRGKSSGEIGEADWDGERGFERGKEVSRGKGGLEGEGAWINPPSNFSHFPSLAALLSDHPITSTDGPEDHPLEYIYRGYTSDIGYASDYTEVTAVKTLYTSPHTEVHPIKSIHL